MFPNQSSLRIAYFSMEICLHQAMPTFSGGLGVLAGDTLRSAADLRMPMIGVTLLHRKGYFRQRLDEVGNQSEAAAVWSPEQYLEKLDTSVVVEIEGRAVTVAVWRFDVMGATGGTVPVFLLDTCVDGNSERDKALTDTLYGGDQAYRLSQEIVLGVGGTELIQKLGYDEAASVQGNAASDAHGTTSMTVYHINEGHAALLTVRLLEQQLQHAGRSVDELSDADVEAVRGRVVFTTHTPVPAGHDRFPLDLTSAVLGEERTRLTTKVLTAAVTELNMTRLALRLSRYVNGVSMRHGGVSRTMFPDAKVDSITNGVHAATWVAEPFARLFDREFDSWRRDNRYLRHAMEIPLYDIRAAHAECKAALFREVTERTGVRLDADTFTIGFARRATPYKRADLIFSDLNRLQGLAKKHGPIQLIFAGKAHPHDEPGKELIRKIFRAAKTLGKDVRVVYVEGYDMKFGGLMTSGVDVWLNTPLRPQEASGTSGMKAALNGVPSLSVLDGWWIEGHIEGATGWSIGDDSSPTADPSADQHELYYKLDRVILPLFYRSDDEWTKVMRNAIVFNGSYFNTQRMLLQYLQSAYLDDSAPLAT